MNTARDVVKDIIVATVNNYPGIHRVNLSAEIGIKLTILGIPVKHSDLSGVIDEAVEEGRIKLVERPNKRFPGRTVKNYFPIKQIEKRTFKDTLKRFFFWFK